VPSQVGIPGSNLLTIANTGTMMAEIDVDEADIPRVSSGQAVMLHPTAFPDRTIVGRVASIALSPKRGPQGEAQGLHYNVRVSLPDATPLPLRTGMRCRAEIDTGQRTKVLAVPIHALLMADDEAARHHVFVDVAGKAERRDVTVGLSDDSQQQILSGLAKGDVVVTGPYRTLRALQPGDSIAPEKKTP
jgi:HlyD family secretion protein